MEEQVVIYSFAAIGHLISTVELAKLLLSQKPRLSITILIPTPPFIVGHAFSYISSYASSVSSVFSSISFVFFPPVPLLLGDPSNYTSREHFIFENLHNNNPHVHQFLQSISLASPVSAFIMDFFCYPALDVAQSFNIPTYFYHSSNAAVLTLFLNFPVLNKNIAPSDSFRNLGTAPFEIPGLFSFPANHILEPMLDRGVSYDEFVKMGAYLAKSDGIIVNSFESLEPRAVKCLNEGTCLPGAPVPPVHCIGPLIAERSREDGEESNECLSWLDLQPNRSVVYLCFGSVMGMFSKEQLREIAIGLEKSGVRFLWVVRPPLNKNQSLPPPEPDLDSILPDGFLARTKDRGLVVKSWVPQIPVLRHKAVGAFVSHCGWNSALEAVGAGVPIVAWPLYAEQRFNKIVLVEEIKIALPMNESEDRFVSSNEIEKRVKQVMNLEEGNAIRERVMNLSQEAKAALGDGGSSVRALARLIESWKR